MYACGSKTPHDFSGVPMIFDNEACNGKIESSRFDVSLKLHFKEPVIGDIEYLAAAPPDYRQTFTGSGLPFGSKAQAFSMTPNKGSVKIVNGEAELLLMLPNSYYDGFENLVGPYVDVMYETTAGPRHLTIRLDNAVPFRLLDYPEKRTSPTFYEGGWQLPVRTQEQILLASGYPPKNEMPDNFWGLKPRQ